ncbi:hypothetical protein [Botrimarina hoheduenensis]|nr:hypothetical protein [Botrimarina hoheduenensis]
MRILNLLSAAMVLVAASSANAALIAYWDQNSNSLPAGGFGFETTDFPQAADQGAGALTLIDFDTTAASGAYTTIQSFSGSTVNAQPTIASGGSLSPQGGNDLGGGVYSNNGMSIVLEVSTVGYEDILVSWAQRGTSTGFASRAFSYSTDGVTYSLFDTDLGTLGSSFVTESYDLSAIAAVEGASSVFFKITLDGATSATGNNRFDNITVEGTVIPEPGSALLVLLGTTFASTVALRSRLG